MEKNAGESETEEEIEEGTILAPIIRYAVYGLVVLLFLGAIGSLLYYQKENKRYKTEKAALQKVWDDHDAKVKETEQDKK